MHTLLLAVLLTAAPPPAAATVQQQGGLLKDTWANRAGFFVGTRAGLAIPPGANSLAPNLSIEMGVAPSRGFGVGLRAMWMNAPPGVPFLGLNPGVYGFGAMADFRFYIETIDPLIIYPTIALGFLAGPDALTGKNLVLPLFNPGLGAKLRFGNFYVGFEFGVSGFTIPFMAMTAGYQADSKLDKQRARLERAGLLNEDGEPIRPQPVPAPAAAPAPAAPAPAPAVDPQTTSRRDALSPSPIARGDLGV